MMIQMMFKDKYIYIFINKYELISQDWQKKVENRILSIFKIILFVRIIFSKNKENIWTNMFPEIHNNR